MIVISMTMQAGCVAVNLSPKAYDPADFYFVREPNQRQQDPDVYFKHEYRQINTRRGGASEARPPRLLGLSLSGGGIRSAAFQLGLLAGLHSTQADGRSLLARVDYISSVSGGSWANGAYWSAPEPDAQFFDCLDRYAFSGTTPTGCDSARLRLRNRQEILLIPFDDEVTLIQRKEKWEQDIIEAYVGACNVDFDQRGRFRDCLGQSALRPYPIFNSTHSSSSESAKPTHFPFESTPDYLGTLVDDPEIDRGFFVRPGSADFRWQLRKWQRYFALTAKNREDRPGAVLSLILAHSSGVIGSKKPYLLQYNFHVRFHGRAIRGVRRTYHLTDGGKSENLGILPLLERGVDTIVVSQMGKEGQELEDPRLAAAQASSLFYCKLPAELPRDTPAVVVQRYSCPTKSGGFRKGTLIQIRPTTTNVQEFLAYLQRNQPGLYAELMDSDRGEKKAEDHFPETPTFRSEYSKALIRAYYLLGRYLASTAVRTELLREGRL